jgi:hypothetical protein
MHGQIMRRTKLLAPLPTPLKLRNQAIRLCPASLTRRPTNSVRIHPSTSAQHDQRWKNGVARTSTIDRHNQSPKPFIWTAKANDILEKVTRARTALLKA